MKDLKLFLIKRSKEPSSLIGIVAAGLSMAHSFGAPITGDQIAGITGFMGAVLFGIPDKQHVE